jgi:Holliday junction resolvase RusA-like endonuclease
MNIAVPDFIDRPFAAPLDVVVSLPMPPSTNNLFTGLSRRRRSLQYEDWITFAGLQLNRQRPVSVAGKVSLLIEVEEPKTARHQDCTNRIKAVEDLLVSHRVIEGDDQRFVREVIVRWADVEGVRVTIKACA